MLTSDKVTNTSKPYVHEEKGQFRRMLQFKVKFKQEIWTAMATVVT